MYNNHQGIYTIRGDMCYENKLMANTALPGRPPAESICLTVSEQDRNSATPKRKRRLRFTPVIVTNVFIGILVFSSLVFLEYGPTPVTKLGFYCKDPTISLPYKGDSVSLFLVLGGSIIGPLLLMTAIELYREKCFNKRLGGEIWFWFRDFMIGLIFNLVLTQVGKVVIGEHRPHFLDTCLPDTGQTCVPGEFVPEYKCTNTFYSNYIITDSSRSFPSGHASVSVYTSLFCAFYVQLRLSSRHLRSVIKPFIIACVLLWSVTCCFTRITDYRHHWWDVLAGLILGIGCVGYTIIALCKPFEIPLISSKTHRPSASTTTLLDVKNKDATSVII
ncbi:hypothetical protein RN001_000037 [Aquatica leii]|uniref:Phosphatidic acid phosphatase type 2/haloperoxidase domain-containing protein n=1 Tax=Aquatica leii TaxID=1421715 RepID=A0AAN7PJG9_9COLE|nr:hypothetical protein RN001_000037 [Aquatica leii]